MAYKLVISKEAHNDTDDIVRYIAIELCSPASATGFLDDVEKSYKTVIDNPRMYGLCNDYRLHKEGYRKIIIKNYLILYRIDDEQKAVLVVRIIYGGRNYTELL